MLYWLLLEAAFLLAAIVAALIVWAPLWPYPYPNPWDPQLFSQRTAALLLSFLAYVVMATALLLTYLQPLPVLQGLLRNEGWPSRLLIAVLLITVAMVFIVDLSALQPIGYLGGWLALRAVGRRRLAHRYGCEPWMAEQGLGE